MKILATAIPKLLAALLLASGVGAALAQIAPTTPAAAPAATVSVPDSMVQPVKRKKTRTTVTRRTVHKHTVARHTHSHAESTAAGSAAK